MKGSSSRNKLLTAVLTLTFMVDSSLVFAVKYDGVSSPETTDTISAIDDSTVNSEADSKKKKRKKEKDPNRYQVLPIPIFITEPAIGKGLGVALALFHPVKGGSQSPPRASTPSSISAMEDDQQAPPVVTGVFGAYTSSKTWAAGVGHMNHWKEDSIRYAGALGYAHINSKFYLLGVERNFTMDGALVYQDIKFRVKDSNIFLGTALSYMDAKSKFDLGFPDEVTDQLLNLDIRNVGLAARAFYDTRDNTTNPVKGQLVELSLWRYDGAIGGRYNYWSATVKALAFHPFGEKFILGLRLDVTGVNGRPPFFGYPWVKLRGIPAMRYQDQNAGAVEIEGRYRLAPKWEVLAFAGKGFTSGDGPLFDNPKSIYNFGVGGRFKVLEAQNVWLGLDAARGPEDWAWYIQVGHPW
jgi:hypothetical protein